MIDLVLNSLLIILLVSIIVIFYFIVRNERVYNSRVAYIKKCAQSEDPETAYKKLDEISYEQQLYQFWKPVNSFFGDNS